MFEVLFGMSLVRLTGLTTAWVARSCHHATIRTPFSCNRSLTRTRWYEPRVRGPIRLYVCVSETIGQ